MATAHVHNFILQTDDREQEELNAEIRQRAQEPMPENEDGDQQQQQTTDTARERRKKGEELFRETFTLFKNMHNLR